MNKERNRLKLAIIGTNGLPPKYGGFETLAEYLVKYLSNDYKITVFCSSKIYSNRISQYNNCELRYINLKANGWQSIFYDAISLMKTYKDYDIILMLGMCGSFVMPFMKKYNHKFVLNFGGLDWQRSKWNFIIQKVIQKFVSQGIKYSGHLISDNIGIQEYIMGEYKKNSTVIAYGGDQVFKVDPSASDREKYPFLNGNYAFTVARIQPDNNIDMLLESFLENAPFPFVFVGNWGSSSYGIKTKARFLNHNNIIMLDAIYDLRELNLLRSNCKIYLHGHSAGGTNPALVEAMNLALPIFAYDCIFNRYTTEFEAEYFSSSVELMEKLSRVSEDSLTQMSKEMYSIAKESYQWETIAQKYSDVFKKMDTFAII